MEVFGTIVRFFQNGGLFMYPIVIILAIGLSIAIERYIYLTRSEAGNRKLWEKLQPLLSNGDYAGAFEVSSKSEAAVGQVLAYGISRMRTSSDRQDVEMSMEESLLEVTPPAREAHALPGRVGQRRHIAGPVGNHYRPDPGLYGRGQRQPG